MKISFVLPSLPRQISGGTKIVFEYANYLASNNEVTIYYMVDKCLRKYHVPQCIGFLFGRIVAPFYPKWIRISSNIQVRGVYKKNQVKEADFVIATARRTADFVKELPKDCGEKAYFIQDFENWSYTDEEVYDSYRFGMVNIVIAQWLKDIVEKQTHQIAYYIRNGINTNVFKIKEPIKERKVRTVAFHYRSEAIKGGECAIAVIKSLKQKYKDLEVFVVGREERPQELPAWCYYIHNASPQQISDINNKVSIFLCTSIIEGFGLPGLEAMACGCALVTTDYLGAREYAVDGKNSLIAPVNDINGLVDRVSELFDNNELRIKIATDAAGMAMHYSFNDSAGNFLKILENIYEKKRMCAK